MNNITNTSQNISTNCSFSATNINTQLKLAKKTTYTEVINTTDNVEVLSSANKQNNASINAAQHSANASALEKKLLLLVNKSQLNKIITNRNGSPDYLSINIYWDTLRSWYTPNKMKDINGKIIEVKKLKTKGIYTNYNKLSDTHGYSKETIRKKLVKLENLGLIQRSYQHRETVTTKSYNQLIIYVLKQTPHFFNKNGIDASEVSHFKAQTNHAYIATKYNIDYQAKIALIKVTEKGGGIHKLVDTKQLIEPFNKLKDRSNESNFFKKNSELNSLKLDPKLEKTTEDLIECKNNNFVDEIEIKESKFPKINKNGFFGKGKNLEDMLDYLTNEMCDMIRAKCSRNFTNRAIREITKAVSHSKKGTKAFFYHIKGFIAYVSKMLIFEKRQAVQISSDTYYIKVNQTKEQQEINKQEKYLTNIEYSLQVSPEWYLKKKLAAVLERSKAYNILIAYHSLKIIEGNALITLHNQVQLSKIDKEIILQQIQATHETMDNAGNYQCILSLEIKTLNKFTTFDIAIQSELNFPKREGIWGKIRETFVSYFGSQGDGIDKSWLSKLNATIDQKQQTIELEAPNLFIKDWITSNYLHYIERAAKVNGLLVEEIKIKI